MIDLLGLRACVALALLGIVSSPASGQSRSSPQNKGVIVISGAKNPADIPQWAVWEGTFSTIALFENRQSPFTDTLAVSEVRHVQRYCTLMSNLERSS